MSFGWCLLLNGLIGVVVYICSMTVFQRYCYKKFGEQAAEDGLHTAMEQSAEVGSRMSMSAATLMTVNLMMTFLLWEIEIPCKYLMIYFAAKACAERRRKADQTE